VTVENQFGSILVSWTGGGAIAGATGADVLAVSKLGTCPTAGQFNAPSLNPLTQSSNAAGAGTLLLPVTTPGDYCVAVMSVINGTLPGPMKKLFVTIDG
jgi:hypothetical protein